LTIRFVAFCAIAHRTDTHFPIVTNTALGIRLGVSTNPFGIVRVVTWDALDEQHYLEGVLCKVQSEYDRKQAGDAHRALVARITRDPCELWTVCEESVVQRVLVALNHPYDLLTHGPLDEKVASFLEQHWEKHRFSKYTFHPDGRFTHQRLPRNFTWVGENVAGCGQPSTEDAMKLLEQQGVQCVITLMENPLPSHLQACTAMKHQHVHVVDRTPMSLQQMQQVVSLIEQHEKTVVHCLGGVGRTATALVAYLMWSRQCSVSEALDSLPLRKTVLTESQKRFLHKEWYKHCCEQAPWPQDAPKKKCKLKLPSLLMLVGLPASGKSTFANTMEQQLHRVIRVSQDELRKKGACEHMVSEHSRRGDTVILDRCNLRKDERQKWMDLNLGMRGCAVIHFSASVEECMWRIKHRKNHPTVRPEQGATVIRAQAKRMEAPTKDEPVAYTVSSFKEANQLLLKMGCTVDHLHEENHDHIQR